MIILLHCSTNDVGFAVNINSIDSVHSVCNGDGTRSNLLYLLTDESVTKIKETPEQVVELCQKVLEVKK